MIMLFLFYFIARSIVFFVNLVFYLEIIEIIHFLVSNVYSVNVGFLVFCILVSAYSFQEHIPINFSYFLIVSYFDQGSRPAGSSTLPKDLKKIMG